MKIEEIFEQWNNDSTIDKTELGNAALNIPKLHHKYYKIFSHERLLLKKLEQDMKRLRKLKWEYYCGILDHETLQEQQWEPIQLKILKQDIPTYMDSDENIINLNLRIAIQQEKIELLESIIRNIMNMGYNVKAAIDWVKFTSGQ